MFVPYATRERVAAASDVKSVAWLDGEIDLAIEQGSRAVDKLCRRGDDTRPAFAPWYGAIEYDWPTLNDRGTYRRWLGPHALLTIGTVTTGGDDATTAAIGYPPEFGAPYDALDLDQADGSTFTTSDGIGQRSLSITGTWCATPVSELTMSGWTLTGSINASVTTAGILAPIGVGSLIRIGSERMVVTDRTWLDTGDTSTLTASMSDMSMAVTDGTDYVRGDVLIVGAERVKVRDIVGNSLIVQRAVDGSALAAHTTAPVYALRTCSVARGALGTTAASHTAGDSVYVYRFPPVVEQLAVAYALDQRAQETSGYGRKQTGPNSDASTSGAGISILEQRVLASYGRTLFGSA